ncbi:MAG TPA: dienelactone hydrolase family protein [Anaerolineae bacterium]|jgi:carboxymethylenebutenolidase
MLPIPADGLAIDNLVIPLTGSSRPAIDAYRVSPQGDGPFPGVIVIHEMPAISENIRDIARRLARQGYVALAVDLMSHAPMAVCMMRVMNGMMFSPLKNGIVAELQQALDFLQASPGVDPKRVGVIGFCMGGTFALQMACTDRDVKAASVFYGMNPRPFEAVAQACPIVGSYPERDFTASAGRNLDKMLERYNVPHDIKEYPDARHSFFNDDKPAFDADASADAWQRVLAFFKQHIG